MLNIQRISTRQTRWNYYTRHLDDLWQRMIQLNNDDDSVSIAYKEFNFLLAVSLMLWLLTYFFVMLDVLTSFIPRGFVGFLVFVPMWCGSLLGITSAILIARKICTSPTLVSRERRLFMRAQGVESLQFIDYDSLPLMRSLFCRTTVTGVTFALLLVSQILYYHWFTYGTIGLWHALVPAIIILVLFLLYLYTVEVFSLFSCAVLTLGVVELVSQS